MSSAKAGAVVSKDRLMNKLNLVGDSFIGDPYHYYKTTPYQKVQNTVLKLKEGIKDYEKMGGARIF
jgi:hypothetical protein